MKITPELEAQAYEFARWTYDWNESSFLGVDELSITPSHEKTLQITSKVWAVNEDICELQLTVSVYELTEEQLEQSSSPINATDQPDANFIDGCLTGFELFTDNPGKLNDVPKDVLVKAVDIICENRIEVVTDLCFDDPVDDYVFLIPDFHPQVKKIVRKYCRAEAISRRRQARESRRQNRRFELVIKADKETPIKAGRKAAGVLGCMGTGIGIFNGMAGGYGASEMGSAIRFAEWLKIKQAEGCTIYPVSGIFKGEHAEGPLVVAVCNITKDEAESRCSYTWARSALFIGPTRLVQIIAPAS